MAATFKTEKQFQEWLAANPKAAARMPTEAPKPKLATSDGVAVVVKMPASRPARPDCYRSLTAKFNRAMAWLFVGVVGLGALGVVGCVSGILALEYLR